MPTETPTPDSLHGIVLIYPRGDVILRDLIQLVFLFCTLTYPSLAQSHLPNLYNKGEQWGALPEGRIWGSTSAIDLHRNREGDLTGKIWVFERCGPEQPHNCVGSTLDPVMLFDLHGRLIHSFGSGMFVWPHGIHVDYQGNVWLTDAVDTSCKTGKGKGKGHQVHKFSSTGAWVMSLGTKGVEGDGEHTFRCPSDVVVSREGYIFVGDGHGNDGNNRIVKFSRNGKFVSAWGRQGTGPGEYQAIHALAIDSRGRLFVGDRGNHRIQLLDQDGNYITAWHQFGSPSGVYIDESDNLYVADSDSGYRSDEVGGIRNPGFKRGIYIGNALTGEVTAFIPDPKPDLSDVTSGAEGVIAVEDFVFGAQVSGSRGVLRYSKTK